MGRFFYDVNSTLITIAIVSVLIFYEPFYSPILILVISLLFFLIFKINSKAILQKGQKVNINQNFFIDIFENAVGYFQEIIITRRLLHQYNALNIASEQVCVNTE